MPTPEGVRNYKQILGQAFDEQVNPEEIKQKLQEIASKGKSYIYTEAPKLTGFMASQTDCQAGVRGPYSILLEARADYSGYVNNGTFNGRPQPFFDRTIEMITDELERLMQSRR